MKIIGITGSSGAGKTTISNILKDKYDAEVINADEIAKKLSKKGTIYLSAIVEYFGSGILNDQGELKRKQLASIIYEDYEKRNQLNELTFIYVVDEINKCINNVKEQKQLIVIDAPLLFESKLDQICDIVIGVIANEEEKIQRICDRDHISKEMARKRLKIQKKNDFIKEFADYIIINDSDMNKLKKEIEKIPLKKR